MKQAIIALLLLLPVHTQAEDVITASFQENLAGVEVSLCFDGRAPSRLYLHKQAGEHSSSLFHEGTPLEVSRRGSMLELPALPDNTCLNWQTDFISALNERDYRLVLQRGDDLVMDPRLWFWKGPKDRDLLVETILPAGISISTPWKEVKRAGSTMWFRPDKTSSDWESRIALGKFKLDIIKVPGAEIRLAAAGDLSAAQRTQVRAWIEQAVNSVSSVYGFFPQAHPQVLVVPVGARSKAVLWANVLRGGGMASILYIDETRPLEDFMEDWTTTHEFSHMLIPYVSSRDRWLSEGLASYYQNVLRARDGRLTDTEAWQALYDGFERGRKGTRGGSLKQATRGGGGSIMRVYWSGAALLLMADKRLRETTNGLQSLDTALESLWACCMANGTTWRARDMLQQLDKLTGTSVFMDLYEQWVPSHSFPDLESTWEDLGINTRFGRVSLTSSAPSADVRDAIMRLE